MIKGVRLCTALELLMMPDEKSLMLCWRSLSGVGSDIVASLSAHKGGQYWVYRFLLLPSRVIIEESRPEIGDTPLTLISRMEQRA